MNAIEVHALTKTYGEIQALRGVELTVKAGNIVGLLGPNGSGKSTLIKALVGSLRPTSGTVKVLGLDPLTQKKQLRPQIGYMPQAPALYNDLSPRENLRFFGSAHGVPQLKQRIEEALTFTELTTRADDPVRTFSGGMLKRVSLACALLHEPTLLLLDEPTAAVDPQLKVRSWELFRQLAQAGKTLFISTHLMDEALLCDQVVVQRQGQVIAVDTPAGLLQRGHTRLTILQADHASTSSIASTPQALAQALYAYGLPSTVGAIDLQPDTLEAVLLQLIEEDV